MRDTTGPHWVVRDGDIYWRTADGKLDTPFEVFMGDVNSDSIKAYLDLVACVKDAERWNARLQRLS